MLPDFHWLKLQRSAHSYSSKLNLRGSHREAQPGIRVPQEEALLHVHFG